MELAICALYVWLLSVSKNVFKVHPCCSIISVLHSFLWLMILYEYAIFCLSTHQLMDIRVASTVWILWVAPLWTFLYKLCKYVLLVLLYLVIYLGGIDRSYGNSMFSFLRNCQPNCLWFCFYVVGKKIFKEWDLLINGNYMKFEFHHLHVLSTLIHRSVYGCFCVSYNESCN